MGNRADGAEVLCAGILVADLFAPPLPRLPAAGELLPVDEFLLTVGGCAANTALGLKRLGRSAAVVGAVGADAAGDFVVDALAQHGVDTRGIRRTTLAPTSRTVILPVVGEDRRYIHAFGANAQLSAADMAAALDATSGSNVRVLHVGGYLIMPGVAADELAALFARARSRGILTVLDVAGVPAQGGLDRVRAVLPHTDLFLPNLDEATLLTGEQDAARQAGHLLGCGAQAVCITMGGAGALFAAPTATLFCPAWPVQVVDPSGGGDAFAAGLIAAHLAHKAPADALAFAAVVGASACTALGCTAGILAPDAAEAAARRHAATIVAR